MYVRIATIPSTINFKHGKSGGIHTEVYCSGDAQPTTDTQPSKREELGKHSARYIKVWSMKSGEDLDHPVLKGGKISKWKLTVVRTAN